mmetsp:Transcript_3210/g.8191  ORF Transcript_3210/g.8191 Transcript_3210/m.8191 type:complete len:156 (+) Transcript_3210:186-653(+)|eukprot:CAMPEP_0181127250 /NCGR_PEP_ID=MMETSP1071-20121207/28091_1 /TAXON_ID=35127 /ORGANISM="Thalassiosira sp., Strain NH16" /LENGTH=155 /DNA_ID=CAMNT_0023212963 /DNA_START=122 /DNA_END=589 /DNA_ORIENTATION=+
MNDLLQQLTWYPMIHQYPDLVRFAKRITTFIIDVAPRAFAALAMFVSVTDTSFVMRDTAPWPNISLMANHTIATGILFAASISEISVTSNFFVDSSAKKIIPCSGNDGVGCQDDVVKRGDYILRGLGKGHNESGEERGRQFHLDERVGLTFAVLS